MNKLLGHSPRIAVAIKANHIADGLAADSSHCMIAEAIREAHPELVNIAVDIQTIRASDRSKRERYIWLTPRVAQEHIIQFDFGMKPKPISFQLRDGQTITIDKTRSREADKKAKAKAAMRRPRKGTKHSVPAISGGEAPPHSIGRRRQFGLRAFEFSTPRAKRAA